MDTSPTSTSPGYGPSKRSAVTQSQLNKVSEIASTPLSTASKSSTAKAGSRQITRNRASYSCHTCRRRKVKCDKVHPVCGNCYKNGTECIYDTAPQKDTPSHNGQTRDKHGVKRRRGSSRQLEDDVDDIGSLYGHLRQDGPPEQKSGAQAIEARLDKLTSMIERLSKTNGPLDAADRHLLAQNVTLEAVKNDTRQQNGANMKSSGTSRPDSPCRADSSSDEFPIPAGHATDLVDPVGSLNLGHLSLDDGGRSRYVGTTYWAYISHEINELNQLLKYQSRSHNDAAQKENSPDETMTDTITKTTGTPWKTSAGSPGETVHDRITGEAFQKSVLFPSNDSPSVQEKLVEPEMLDYVPTKRQSHILYKGFMSGIHAISPVIHPPTILKLYNAFWDWYDYGSYSGEPCPDPSFIPLLYAIWYGGSVTISIRTIKAEFNVSSRSALSKTFNDEVTRWLTKISFPRSPSLQGLAAYLLVQTILSKEEEPLTSSLFISLSMRVAQTMGLHRDPAKFGIKPFEAEYRRRIWWHIVHMDGVVAMSSGLPPLVSDENFWDVRDASEVKDTLLGTPEAEKYEELVASGMRSPDNPDDPTVCGGPSMVNVYYLSARGKYVMARAVRRILKIQLGTKPVTRRDMEELRSILLDLQLKLNSIINRIPEIEIQGMSSDSDKSLSFSISPAEMRSSDSELPGEGPNGCAEQYHSPVLISFHKWARILLSLFIDKAFCVAYQPFLKNAKSRIWPAARHSALRHCHGFMEKFISLATDPDYQPFQWSWPGNHQPMHAAMIMLIDLYERPHSPEAPKSRAFIDKIFSLTGPDGGVVGGEDGISAQRPLKDGGREAWDMIRRLRQKAWQKAGLDPQKLWTEQAQIQAGAAASAADEYPCASNPYYANTGTTVPSPSMTSRQQLADFSKMFYNMTRSHMLPNPVSTLRPSPLRYQLSQPSAPTSMHETPPSLPTPQLPQSPTPAALSLETPSPSTTLGSPERIPPLTSTLPFSQPSSVPTPPPIPFMDTGSPSVQSMAAPTPPSMVDPNLNFDWDQWDAVFGQHLPVADELMELDPVAGFEFGDLGGGRVGVSRTGASLAGSESGFNSVPGPDWVGYC
ncbi:fungal-specific transcription factor domain-containing protein [Aspergillus avenaceus]|uniref:Fungal-specific transcription factor domain-containing protein n=1 Tax=Aspergillus avenaceus TaxID=36643 RepID=A0A5N6TD81_ASPAV|nr:fungal-specific transcription factor domain-containing protein [Aspergillus avenaceus]